MMNKRIKKKFIKYIRVKIILDGVRCIFCCGPLLSLKCEAMTNGVAIDEGNL